MRRRGTGLGDEVSRIVQRLDKSGRGLLQVRVAEAWESIAGPSATSHTTGAHIRGRELVIHVDSPVWATELSALAELYRKEINKHLEQEVVESIRFTVSNQAAKRREQEEPPGFDEPGAAEVVESIPLTEAELRQVEASTSGIKDEELRQTVLRATIADLEWKKGLAADKCRQEGREGP